MTTDPDDHFAKEARKRRWIALSEDGPMFGRCQAEHSELVRLTEEFGIYGDDPDDD